MKKPLFALAFSLLACGSSNDAQPAGHVSKPQDPDSTVFDVKWKSTTVELTESDAAGLSNPNPDAGVLHFDAPTAAVKALHAGDYFVLPGSGLFHVATVTPSGSALDLGVDPASLIDAADSGHVAWDIGVHHMNKSPVGVIGPASLPQGVGGGSQPVTFSGTVSGYDVTVTLTPDGDRTDVSVSVKLNGSAGQIDVELTGWVQAFRSQGDLQWSGGSGQSFALGISGYHADLSLTYDYKAVQGTATHEIPLSMSWPFALGPIPMYVSISTAFDLQATLNSSTDTAKGSAHYVYSGNFGVNGATFAPSGGLTDSTFSVGDSSEQGAITAGIGALLEAPKVSVGMGVPAASTVFDANVYVKVKNEVVSNLVIPNPGAPGKPSCLQISCGVGAYFGGQLTLLGVPVQAEKPIVEKSKIVAQTGSACQ